MSASSSGSGPGLDFLNTRVVIHQSALQSPVGLCVQEHQMPSGYSPPLHRHHTEDEIFHVLAGRIRFQVEGRDTVCEAGQTVVAPKGAPHSFVVESPGGACALVMTRGGDFEGFVRALGEPARSGAVAPPPDPSTLQDRLVAAGLSYGIEMIGPPLA